MKDEGAKETNKHVREKRKKKEKKLYIGEIEDSPHRDKKQTEPKKREQKAKRSRKLDGDMLISVS